MIYSKCNQTQCRHCAIFMGEMCCTVTAAELITVPDTRSFILKCNTYKKHPAGNKTENIGPGSDGLYPGQIKSPTQLQVLAEKVASQIEQRKEENIENWAERLSTDLSEHSD